MITKYIKMLKSLFGLNDEENKIIELKEDIYEQNLKQSFLDSISFINPLFTEIMKCLIENTEFEREKYVEFIYELNCIEDLSEKIKITPYFTVNYFDNLVSVNLYISHNIVIKLDLKVKNPE